MKLKKISFLLSLLLFFSPVTNTFAESKTSTASGSTTETIEYTLSAPVLPPVAICRNILVTLGPSGSVTITGAQVDGGSYDPDGSITARTVTPNTFSCSQTGPNTVTLTVTDNEGLTSSCSAIVTVADRTNPSVLCKNATIYLDLSGKALLDVSDIDNGSADNCPSGTFLFLSRKNFSCSDIGSPVPVTLTATDGSGNTSSCTAQVTVLDTVKPRVFVKPFELVLGPAGTGTLHPEDVDNGTFDNCGAVSLSVNLNTFTCSDIGSHTVILTATDAHGNTASRRVVVTVSTDLKIKGISLSSCDITPTLALFQSNVEGGNGVYSYFWKGLDETVKPFMVVNTWPPSVHFYNSSTLATPYFNNNIPNDLYVIRLVITDGNGCRDTSDITIDKTGPVFNNQTYRNSQACEGEVAVYSVNYVPNATYSWSAVNGTIISSDQDTSRVAVRWNPGATTGIVTATLEKQNPVFPGGQCESTVVDSVSLIPVPVPSFDNPVLIACSGTDYTYTLTGSYDFYSWTVTGGVIAAGGTESDNNITVRWGNGATGKITVSTGNVISCMGSSEIDIAVDNLSGTITSLRNVTCNGMADGSAVAEATSGTGSAPYMYSLDGGALQASGSFGSLAPGNHNITITDALLCTWNLPFVITQPSPVYGSVSSLKDVSCFGGSDGSAEIQASGGVAPYRFSLNSGALQGSDIFNNLAAGTYTVTISDNNGCLGTVIFNITQPVTALAGSANASNISCFGGSDGAVSLTVTGGVQPYSYIWSNGATTKDISGLAAGNYSVNITDSRGCVIIINSVLTQPAAAVSGTAVITNVKCTGDATGAIDLLVSGGVPPYGFLWSNGSTTEDISALTAGTYTVTITDANGCTTSYSGSVTEPPAPVGGSLSAQADVQCRGGSDGRIVVIGTGGTPPYEFNIDGGTFISTGIFEGLSAGNHIVMIRDNNLCTFSLPVVIAEPSASLGGSIVSSTDVKCFGESSGSVTVTGTGGTSPYTYSVDGGAFQSSGIFSNINAGIHNITIRDFNQCIYIIPATVGQPPLPLGLTTTKTDVTCRGGSTGSALAAATGGTPPYAYSWSTDPVQTGAAAAGLSAGTYNVVVTDANGCRAQTAVIIDQPALSFIVTPAVSEPSCFGKSDGSVNLSVANALLPVSYLWNNGSVNKDLSGISAGIYSVTATDSNGCIATSTATVGQPAAVDGIVSVTNVACRDGNSGVVNLTASGGVPPYSYLWTNGEKTEDIDSLIAGIYVVTITDSHACNITVTAAVSQPLTSLGGSIVAQTNVSEYGEGNGSVTVAGSGGNGPYEYMINGGAYQSSGTFGSLYAGVYTVTVRDAGLCTFNISITITQPSIPLSARIISQQNVLCFGGETGSVTVTGWGGTSPYQYSSDGITFQASGTFGFLGAGPDTILIRDAVNDNYRLPVLITEPQPIAISFGKTDVLCRGGATGTATAIVNGGTGPYSYEWNTIPVQTSATAVNLNAGTYTVSVTDSNGCNSTADIVIIQPNDDLTVSFTQVNPRCSGGRNGNITAVVSGGTGPYSFTWDTDPVQTTAVASTLGAGTYTVAVADFNGCTASGSVTLTDPNPVVIEYSSTSATCPDSNDGTITLEVSGGSPPYNFIWSDNSLTQNLTKIKPGTYSVVVTDQNSCASSADIVIDFIGTFACVEIPQVITPNNDGYNDTWILKNIDMYPDAELLVFNRWGKLIFRTKNISANPWDGRVDGKLVPTDSYHYILYLNDGSAPKTGVISVIR